MGLVCMHQISDKSHVPVKTLCNRNDWTGNWIPKADQDDQYTRTSSSLRS